jgi:deazaflavin-dependent oxidoreductase (nitroreductase family)
MMSELDNFNQAVIKEFRANQGKVGGQMEGMPVMLLTMTGAKTGRSLVRPLVYTRDGDRIVIVASFAGAPHNPPWYHNLIANPVATVEIGAETFKVRATPVTGAERERLFNQHAAKMPIFNEYRQKTARQIPVLVLERI